jgi:pSer/pThr/pTyr-binding forkhead associated (FHA) protein
VKQPSPEEFLEACGARVPFQVALEQPGRSEMVRRTLALPFALIGRDKRADFALDDEQIGFRHAYLQMVAGRVWCVDLGSRTGIHWQSERKSAGPVDSDHDIRIGPYTLRLADENAAERGEAPSVPPNPLICSSANPSSLSAVALEFRGDATRQKLWMVDRPLTLLGRASFCKLRMHNPMVSRVHCALLNTAGGLWLIDLLSREGTYVNGTAVRWARLEEADELQIDPFRIGVHFLTSPVRSAADECLLAPEQSLVAARSLVPATDGASQLLPLLGQFSLMQQQMFDQFQQTLLMMAEMFGNLHREQMQRVHQELAQLHEVTRELQGLQAELLKQRPVRTEPPPVSRPSPTVPRIPAPATPSTPDVHGWLLQRLATLQQDRQSRWQKIVGMLTGK